ncbi:MAG: Trp family transcriptional regulator [Bacteroidia bacterium]|nr:Trp family transcriptional regulator [Bacteroidia bacterium]
MNTPGIDPIVQLFARQGSPAEVAALLDVFLTENEREMLAERLAIFRELAKGSSQREVAATLSCSVVTVTRGAKVYRQHKALIDQWLAATAAL